MKIGNILKELRLNNNLTQQQVADAAQVSRSIISQYENNQVEPTASVLAKFSEIFSVSADYILGLEDELGHIKADDLQNAVTPEERKIIAAYRELAPSNKNMVLRMLNIESK